LRPALTLRFDRRAGTEPPPSPLGGPIGLILVRLSGSAALHGTNRLKSCGRAKLCGSMPPRSPEYAVWSPGVGSSPHLLTYLLTYLHTLTYPRPLGMAPSYFLTAYSLTHLLTHPHPRTGCRHSHSGGPIQRRAHSMHVPTYLRTVDHYKPLTVVIQMIHGSTQLDLTQLDLT